MSLPTQDEIQDADEEFWRWIFRENDGPNHPLKISSDGRAQIQLGKLLIVAGSLPDDGQKNRSLYIPSGIENIFVPAENCVYSDADSDGHTNGELVDKANKDMASSTGMVLVNGSNQPLDQLPGHPFSPPLNIQNCIAGTGKSKKGEGESCTKGTPPGLTTAAAAACHYAIIRANTLKTGDTIQITGRGSIKVLYKVQ